MIDSNNLRSMFSSVKNYEFFMSLSPEKFIELKNKEAYKKKLPPKIEPKPTCPTKIFLEKIASKLHELQETSISIILKKYSLAMNLSLIWDGDSAIDIDFAEIQKMQPLENATKPEIALIQLLNNLYVQEGFDEIVNLLALDIMATPQYLDYKKKVEKLVQEIDDLQDTYPNIDWWNLK